MSQSLSIIIVDKSAILKKLTVKNFDMKELYKKCGFKKADDFNLQTEWSIKIDNVNYIIQLYGKDSGKANSENKYEFPPPVDTILYFGSCALIGFLKEDRTFTNLTIELWEKCYEKLYGGFENLELSCIEDENEEDELENIPEHLKTKKGGYLKDGFVVDSSSSDDNENQSEIKEDEEDYMDDIGSELSEESYTE
jgi:hypothetical protein